MRSLAVLVLVLAGCPAQPDFGHDKQNPVGSGSDGSGAAPAECQLDSDCAAVGAKCCDCPSFAVPVDAPSNAACDDVPCVPAPSCPDNVRAACDPAGQCTLVCAAMACSTSCAAGYAMDPDGCLTCTCADVTSTQCAVDSDCVRTRADCCGCMRGGSDTAVPAADQASFDLGLSCPADPACPSVDTCEPDTLPRCIQGGCVLTTATPPGACGTSALPPCPTGQVCTINASDAATMQGIGVCRPPT